MCEASWKRDLLHLHEQGWEAAVIDAACDALIEACAEGVYEGEEIDGLTVAQVRRVVGWQTDPDECESFHRVAVVLCRDDESAEAVRRALDDLDRFVLESVERTAAEND